MMAYSYATDCTYDHARRNCAFSAEDPEMTNQTISHWFTLFREIVSEHFLDKVNAGSKIGGPGHIVQVDEAMIGRRKYNRGRLVEGTWVFGMIDDMGEVRFEIVERRDVQTLTDKLLTHVATGSHIHSDCWRGYSTEHLEWNGYAHSTVNHSHEFVAEDVNHTQRIESQWRSLRRHFSPGGVRKVDISNHLLEYAWRRKCKNDNCEAFNELMKLLRASKY